MPCRSTALLGLLLIPALDGFDPLPGSPEAPAITVLRGGVAQ